MRGVALDLLHDLVRGERRVACDEQVYVVGANRQLQNLQIEFVGFLLNEFFETVADLVLKHRLAVFRTLDKVVLEFVDGGTLPVEPTRHRQYIHTTHLTMVRKHPTPAVAMNVDRFPVVGFIPPVNGWNFASLPL